MANDYQDIVIPGYRYADYPIAPYDYARIFPLLPNWGEKISTDFVISRYTIEYPGTPITIEQKNPETPIRFSASYWINDLEEQGRFLSFIHDNYGQTKKFWVSYPKSSYTLAQDAVENSSELIIENNKFNLHYFGGERICIELKNGDILTRKVESVIVFGNYLKLTLKTALDRNILTTDYWRISKFLLVRLDGADVQLDPETNELSVVKLAFYELVKEYPI